MGRKSRDKKKRREEKRRRAQEEGRARAAEVLEGLRDAAEARLDADARAIMRLKGLDLEPLGDEKCQLVREILRLARKVLVREQEASVPYEQRSCFLHPEIRPRIREIGERLWEITGEKDPTYIEWFFSCDLLSIPPSFRSEIVHVWDGIGPVRA